MIEEATECEKLEFTSPQAFRVVIGEKEYRLNMHYVFVDRGITLYVLVRA